MGSQDDSRRGPIAWMAKNTVAANLLMMFIIVGGLLNLRTTKQEVFPEFEVDLVTVGVAYPGASPSEVEQGITMAVEETVRGIQGVKRVTSTTVEGYSGVIAELMLGIDQQRVVGDIKTAVDRIRTMPEQAEDPSVELVAIEPKVVSLVISGDHDLNTLQALAERAQNGLVALPGITKVTLSGFPPLETTIEVNRTVLEGYGLSLGDIALAIRMSSLELSGGIVQTENGDLLIRVSDRKESALDYADIILRAGTNGARLRLGDIAKVTQGFEESEIAYYFNGKRAVRVTAFRRGMETPQGVSDALNQFREDFEATLPPTVQLTTWDDESDLLRGRIDLLLRNAKLGLVLVMLVLALFLDLTLAFWVALGIPISFMGAFILGTSFGVSINMISLFALIV
ncbi:MAG: efflux RND transporter permease subunit, partial [Myxococcota bacterium]|nr:efflux RND transporter permease subunit [Myxococcota bacterium]